MVFQRSLDFLTNAVFLLPLAKPITWIKRRQSRIAEGAMMLFTGILIAKLTISSGQSMHLIFEMGPALLLQELGHLATLMIALPVALLLGFKRDTMCMTNSIGREPEVAVVVADMVSTLQNQEEFLLYSS